MQRVYILAGLTVLLVMLALAAGFGLSTGWAVKALQDEAMNRLGRSLSVKDGASLEFSPALALRFDGVTLGNPDGFDGAFLTAPVLRIPLGVSDILQRRLVGRFELQSPEVSLEVNGKGDVSWAGPLKGPALARNEAFLIENGTIRFFDHRNGQAMELPQADLSLTLSPLGELNLQGSATLGGRLTGLNAYIKDVGRVAGTGSPFDMVIDAPLLKAAFNGRLSTEGELNLAGPLTLDGQSLRDVAAWINMPIPGAGGLGAFTISGTLDSLGVSFPLRNAAVALEGISASGDIGITTTRLAPLLFAKLAMSSLNLDPYMAVPDISAATWSEAPLTYEALRGLNARVTLAVEHLSLGTMAASAATVEASLADGKLSAVISSEQMSGGRGRIDLELDGTSAAPLFSARLVAEGAAGESLLASFTGHKWLTGMVSADISLSGFGSSVAAIVSTLKGAATFKADEGALVGVDGKVLFAAITERIVDGWDGGGATAFTEFTGSFILADGIAETKDLKLVGKDITVEATGAVDLLRRAVDLTVLPVIAAEGGKRVGLPVPVVIKGPWARPRIYPDVADILLKPEEAFARLKELGLHDVPAPAN